MESRRDAQASPVIDIDRCQRQPRLRGARVSALISPELEVIFQPFCFSRATQAVMLYVVEKTKNRFGGWVRTKITLGYLKGVEGARRVAIRGCIQEIEQVLQKNMR